MCAFKLHIPLTVAELPPPGRCCRNVFTSGRPSEVSLKNKASFHRNRSGNTERITDSEQRTLRSNIKHDLFNSFVQCSRLVEVSNSKRFFFSVVLTIV